MAPSTPSKTHSRRISAISQFSTPATPPTGYVLAQEETPTRVGSTVPPALDFESSGRHSPTTGPPDMMSFDLQHAAHERETSEGSSSAALPSASGSANGSGSGSRSGTSGSLGSDSMLEMLEDEEEDFGLDDEEGDEGLGSDTAEPLVPRSRRRRRRRWDEEEDKEASLFELIPPLLLAHPLPLLPLLALLPYNFLPAGVIFFIPILCALTLLSSCAHIVIVYLSWYLKVCSFEEVFASVTGQYGCYGRWAGRAAVITSTTGLLVSWLGTSYPLLSPLIQTYLPLNAFFTSSILWTILPATALLPSLLPSRMTRSLRRAPIVLALLLPVVTFLVIGRTVEIKKAMEEGQPPLGGEEDAFSLAPRSSFGLGGSGSAGAGLTTLAIFLSPHINTLPIHSTLSRNKRASFPLPCLLSSGILLVWSLPVALVPYYLLPALPDPLPTAAPTTPSGVFARLPADDAWVNVARLLQCVVGLGTCNMWILRSRDSVLGAMGVERGERLKIGRWVGLALWVVVTAIACIGGWVAEKIELLGVISTLAVGWLLPSVFFIITFHVRSPLSIVFPSSHPPPEGPVTPKPSRHSRTDSLTDPSTDHLLARKERQLQKRRLGRRLWQDLIVYVGILPVGCVTIAWALGNLVGLW